MEDSEPSRRPTVHHRRLGAWLRRARLEAGLSREEVAAVKDCSPSKVIGIESEVGSRPRIEVVIQTETVRLTVDGKMSAESLAALAALANGLRPRSPTGTATTGETETLIAQCDEQKPASQDAGDRATGRNAELPSPEKPAAVASGQAKLGPWAITHFRQGIAATFRVAKNIMTELIARLLAHGLGFPP